MASEPRIRGVDTYNKSALTIDQLADRLAARGLGIPDRDRARRYLRHLGYYRLSPYTLPFQVGGHDHEFRDGVEFDDILRLYVSDRSLRLLVLDALERIEVAIRSALTDHMSLVNSDPHWYLDPSKFSNGSVHRRLLHEVEATCLSQLRRAPETNSDTLVYRSALEHYLTTYKEPVLPPSWLMVEALTIGQLAQLIHNLADRSDRTAVARTVGLNGPILESWLRTYVRVRNICAHHGRLWNVGLGVYPAIPRSRAISWLEDRSVLQGRRARQLYPVLVSLQAVLGTVSPHSSWARRLNDLLNEQPRLFLRGIGLPERWQEDAFWARHLLPGG